MASTPLGVFALLVHTSIPLRSATNTLNDWNIHLVRTQKSMLHKCPGPLCFYNRSILCMLFGSSSFIGKRRRHEQKHKAYLLSLPFCKRECLSAPDRSVHTYVFRRVMALPGMLFYTRAEESEGIRPSHFGMSQIRNWVTTESYLILSKASSFAFLYSVFNITWDNK